ncbi:hypothetical protein B0H34DRAFT_713280 [Crassisporium funariophilum]|nr:hypothetical protein B0H34DRAFT_713280 [Crassisporium funariophilum]
MLVYIGYSPVFFTVFFQSCNRIYKHYWQGTHLWLPLARQNTLDSNGIPTNLVAVDLQCIKDILKGAWAESMGIIWYGPSNIPCVLWLQRNHRTTASVCQPPPDCLLYCHHCWGLLREEYQQLHPWNTGLVLKGVLTSLGFEPRTFPLSGWTALTTELSSHVGL